MYKVLITGITGFLGSQVAEKLVNENIYVIGLKRPLSNLWRCSDFLHKIDWVDINDGYQDIIIKKKPDVIIHSAWIGVEAKDRDDWEMQAKNIQFLMELLGLAREVKLKQFLFFGSQAEYGNINGTVKEDKLPTSTNAYGSIKLACYEIFKTFSETHNIEWIWLRLFSLFGEKEDKNWLIPSMIQKMKSETEMNFTKGEQKYAYLYVKDFSQIIFKIISQRVPSGIYNISSDEVRSLKSIIEEVRDIVNPQFILNFGALPYRENQSMHIEGDMSKLLGAIGEINFTKFSVALRQTLEFYNNKTEL